MHGEYKCHYNITRNVHVQIIMILGQRKECSVLSCHKLSYIVILSSTSHENNK